MAKKCRYFSCVRLARVRGDECQACRQRYLYWDKRSTADRLKRRQRLELSAETMREFVGDHKLKQTVVKLFKKEVRANGGG